MRKLFEKKHLPDYSMSSFRLTLLHNVWKHIRTGAQECDSLLGKRYANTVGAGYDGIDSLN